MSDTINPDHYKKGGIETIEYMEAKMSKEEFYGYIKGNALKYISREGLSYHSSLLLIIISIKSYIVLYIYYYLSTKIKA